MKKLNSRWRNLKGALPGLVLAGAVWLVSCTLPDLHRFMQPEDTQPRFTTPAGGERYLIGTSLALKWESERQGFVRLTLCRDDEPVCVIADKTEDDGEYTWQIGNTGIADGYTIKLEITEGFPFKLHCCSAPFILDTPWASLTPIAAQGAANISLAIDKDERPVVFYTQTISLHDTIYASRWEDDSWVTLLHDGMDHSVSSFTGALDENGDPVVLVNKDLLNYADFKQINPADNSWSLLGGEDMKDNLSPVSYSAGYSMVFNPFNQPAFSCLVIADSLSTRAENIYVAYFFWDGEKWCHLGQMSGSDPIKVEDSMPAGVFTVDSITIALELQNTFLDKDNVPFSTSLGMMNGNPVVAYIEFKLNSLVYDRRVCVRHWNGSEWLQLGDYLNTARALHTSLAVDRDGLPVVVILEATGENKNRTLVKKWTGTAWQDLAYPLLPEAGAPTIAIDGQNRPVVATNYGVRRLAGAAWVDLGYPNYPHGGTGLPSWWLAAVGEQIVVAFREPAKPDEIQVQVYGAP